MLELENGGKNKEMETPVQCFCSLGESVEKDDFGREFPPSGTVFVSVVWPSVFYML